MKKTMIQTLIGMMALCLMSACSGNDEDGVDPINSNGAHTYDITLEGGGKFSGEVPKEVMGTYNPVMFVEFNEEANGELLTGLLIESGKFQLGVGLSLDDNGQPSIEGDGPGLIFGAWGTEDKYRPAGPVSMTLKNYKEHNISMYGEEATAASYILTFQGDFKLGDDGEEVFVTGEVVIAAP
ncbi:hypothetical protein KZP23_02095 [Echinicola marina]|uniref:hypothetical protein n=1 Tax=Echinicola marina TaxID=2859768 RepID=UPI001CF6B4B9|nr:hypothetical protein [Echinicola marina]UCS93848.1 hypothetical protein KZP23_02095 [Echinicola marina]